MNFKSIRNALLAASALGLFATAASATPSGAVLFDQPTADSVGTTVASDATFGVSEADDFSLASKSSVTGIEWYGYDFPAGAASTGFTINFYSDAAGLPGSLLATKSVTATGVATGLFDLAGAEIYKYEYSGLTDVILSPSAAFYVSIVGDTGDSTGATPWSWAQAISFGSDYSNAGAGWVAGPDGDLAFTLYGTTLPEPASLALMGAGLVFLARRRQIAK